MWEPASSLDYIPLNAKGSLIVVACPMLHSPAQLRTKWADKAAAVIGDTSKHLKEIVRDILANPQIRAVVFDGAACGRPAYDAFWYSADMPAWGFDPEHIGLVRRFVDLFDDDCHWKSPPQPFWPARIIYRPEAT